MLNLKKKKLKIGILQKKNLKLKNCEKRKTKKI